MAAPGAVAWRTASLPGAFRRRLTALVGAVLVVALTVGLQTTVGASSLLYGAVAVCGLAICTYLFIEERTERGLLVLMLYLGLLDGYLKLRTGQQVVTLGRDALLFSIVSGVLVRNLIRHEFVIPPLTAAVVAYALLVLVQIGNPDAVGVKHSLGALRPHLEFVPLFFLGFGCMRTARSLRVLFIVLLALTAINGVVALVQYQLGPRKLAGWGKGYERLLTGTENGVSQRVSVSGDNKKRVRPFALGSDTGFGGNLAIFAAPGAIALLSLRRRYVSRVVALALGGAIVLAVATAQTRLSVVLCSAAVLGYLLLSAISRRRVQAVAAVGVIAVVSLVAVGITFGHADNSISNRYRSIAPDRVLTTAVDYKRSTFELFGRFLGEYPFGAGLGSVGPAASFSGLPPTDRDVDGESELNFLIVELGIPGLVALAALLGYLIWLGATRIRRVEDDEIRPLLMAMAAGLIAVAIGFAGAAVTSSVPGGPFFWLTAGVFSYWLIHKPRVEARLARDRLYGS